MKSDPVLLLYALLNLAPQFIQLILPISPLEIKASPKTVKSLKAAFYNPDSFLA